DAADEDDRHRTDPDLTPARINIEEKPRVAASEQRLHDAPAVEAGDGQKLERTDREVQEPDRVDHELQQRRHRGDAWLYAKSQKEAHHDPEDQRYQKVGTRPSELVQDLLASGIDPVRLHRHFLPPPDERDEDGDHTDRIDETLQVEREVTEIADR